MGAVVMWGNPVTSLIRAAVPANCSLQLLPASHNPGHSPVVPEHVQILQERRMFLLLFTLASPQCLFGKTPGLH